MSHVAAFSMVAVALISPAICAAESTAVKSRVIPLDSIWGFKLPGTRDVRELEPKPDIKSMKTLDQVEQYYRSSDVHQILNVLNHRPPDKSTHRAGPVFAVCGTGEEALKNARKAFTSQDSTYPDPRLNPGDQASLVFYSYPAGRYVELVSVQKSNQIITIDFRFVQHSSCDMSTHFALIPIGPLPRGHFRVRLNELPTVDQKGQQVKWNGSGRDRVCSGTTLIVKERE